MMGDGGRPPPKPRPPRYSGPPGSRRPTGGPSSVPPSWGTSTG